MKLESTARNLPPCPLPPKKPKAPAPKEVLPKPEDLEEVVLELGPEAPTMRFEKKPAAKPKGPGVVELAPEELIEVREPGELQESDTVEAFEIKGFKNLKVAATLEVKESRKGDPRDRNQDNIIADPETGLIGVFDGVGGEAHGTLASRSAERAILDNFEKTLKEARTISGAEIQRQIVEAQLLKLINRDLSYLAEARKQLTEMIEHAMSIDPALGKKSFALLESFKRAHENVIETKGAATACVGLVHEARDGSRWAVIANVGDSAAYLRHQDGKISPLTQEDSFFNLLNASGALTPEVLAEMKANPRELIFVPVSLDVWKNRGGSEEEYKKIKGRLPVSYFDLKRTVTAALGGRTAKPDASLTIHPLKAGEELIFATDGLSDKFEDPETDEISLSTLARAAQGKTLTQQLDNLRRAAKAENKTLKKDDDIAIVAARVL